MMQHYNRKSIVEELVPGAAPLIIHPYPAKPGAAVAIVRGPAGTATIRPVIIDTEKCKSKTEYHNLPPLMKDRSRSETYP